MTSTIIFSETDKFDGTNWLSWQRLIYTAATACGAYGYLEGTIPQPSTTPTTTATTTMPTEMP